MKGGKRFGAGKGRGKIFEGKGGKGAKDLSGGEQRP